jgi:hypothetical protein
VSSLQTPRLAGFRVDRICGVGVAALPDSSRVQVALAEHDEAQQSLTIATPPLQQAIYDVVPQCSPSQRRAVLQARRSVHAGRALGTDQVELLLEVGVSALETQNWLDAREQLTLAASAVVAILEADAPGQAQALRASIGRGPLALALAVIAPEFLARLGRARLEPGERSARTAFLYLMRASVKPSPLGHLTAVAVHPGGGPTTARTTVPVGLVHHLFAALAATPRFADAFTYRSAPALADGPEGPCAVIAGVSGDEGFLWRDERTIPLVAHTADWAQAASANIKELPAPRRNRLIALGLVVPLVPWRRGSQAPLTELAQALRGSAAADAEDVADALLELDRQVAAVAEIPAAGRPAQVAVVRARLTDALQQTGAGPWTDAVLHEDVTVGDPIGALPEQVAADLRRLGQQLRGSVVRSLSYDVLVQAFRDTVGPGGRVPDAAAFFARLAGDARLVAAVRQARQADQHLPADSDRAWLPVGRTSAPPALAVHYQLAATDAAAVREGQYVLVLNQFGSALGGLLTRFRSVLPPGAVGQTLRPWWAQLYPECTAASLSVSVTVNSLQHNGCDPNLPTLAWPFEPQAGSDEFTGLDALALAHDATTDTLEFRDAADQLVAPVYTGIVPAALCTGAAALALAVMDPWVDATELSRARHPFLRVAAARSLTGDGQQTPRRRDGRLVLARAAWMMPADALPRPERHETDGHFLPRLDAWRRSRGLPAQVFLVAISADPFDAQRRKPFRLDFADPFAVRAVLPLVAGAIALRLEEALPTSAQAWVPGVDGARIAEHISFLAWDRPSGAQS